MFLAEQFTLLSPSSAEGGDMSMAFDPAVMQFEISRAVTTIDARREPSSLAWNTWTRVRNPRW